MKIGITCYPTYGGSGAVATELGLELARRGHEVHFITYDSPFRLRGYTERVYFHQVETRMGRYPLFDHYPYTLALASKQHEVAVREGLEILHVHYAIPHATTGDPQAIASSAASPNDSVWEGRMNRSLACSSEATVSSRPRNLTS